MNLVRQQFSPAALRALLLLCCFLTAKLFGAVTATVDKPVVTLDESITLTLTFDGQVAQRPALPALPNFQQGGMSGQSTQIINGNVRQSFTYQLIPTQPGDLAIPAFQVDQRGATTTPIQIKVLKPGEAQPGGAPPPYFAKLTVPKTNVYVGEVMEIQVQLYAQEVMDLGFPQLPAESGFTIGKWAQPTQQRVAVSNQAYGLFTFRAPITIVKAGMLNIGPVTQPLVVPDRAQRPGFFFTPRKDARAFAEKVTAIALPLPANNVPATFAGAVGQYTVTATVSPTNVAVGDPITVRVQVSGRGWLDAITVPPQPQWRDFKMYAPNAKVESADPNNLAGTKTFEIPIVPQSVAVKVLPSFAFSYFDPEAGNYRTVTTMPTPLNITANAGGAVALPNLTATNATEANPMSDIAHIRPHLGVTVASEPLLMKPWFIAAQFVAPAVWLGLLVRRKRAESLANNPRLRRRREVQALVRDSLEKLRDAANANRSDEFFAILFRALQEQIGERVNVPANSVTEAIVDERLRPAGLPDKTGTALHELFQAANIARYAPTKSSGELNALLARAESALRELQQWEPQR